MSALIAASGFSAALLGAPAAEAAPLSFDCLQIATPVGMNLTCVNPTPFKMNAHFQGNCGPLPMLNEDSEIAPFGTISRQVPCLPGVQSPTAVAKMELETANDNPPAQ